MDFAESCMDDAQTPPDAEVTHKTVSHDAGATLSMRFHEAQCGGALSRVWDLTQGVGLDTRHSVSDSR